MHRFINHRLARIRAEGTIPHEGPTFCSASPVAESPFLLLTFACMAVGGTIVDTDPLDAHCLGFSVIFAGIESGIGCYEVYGQARVDALRWPESAHLGR